MVYGRAPLINLEPDKIVICSLHCNLRIVGCLFEHTILKEIGKHGGKSKQEIDQVCEEVWGKLVEHHIPIKKIYPPKNNLADHYQSITKYSFAGQDCATLLFDRLWEKIVDLVFPPDAVTASPTLKSRVANIKAAWEQWSEVLWPLINKLDYTSKTEKAASVRDNTKLFIPLLRKACAKTTEHLYPHLLFHLAEQIEACPVDPYFFQTQGLEHRHSLRKKYHLLNTNFKKPGLQTSTIIAAYHRKDGRIVREHLKKSSISRGQQVVEITVTLDHLRSLLCTHECEVQKTIKLEHENKLRKVAWKNRKNN